VTSKELLRTVILNHIMYRLRTTDLTESQKKIVLLTGSVSVGSFSRNWTTQ